MTINKKNIEQLNAQLNANLDKLLTLDQEIAKELIFPEKKNTVQSKIKFSDGLKKTKSFSEKRQKNKASLNTQEKNR